MQVIARIKVTEEQIESLREKYRKEVEKIANGGRVSILTLAFKRELDELQCNGSYRYWGGQGFVVSAPKAYTTEGRIKARIKSMGYDITNVEILPAS